MTFLATLHSKGGTDAVKTLLRLQEGADVLDNKLFIYDFD
jgi:hypothetical protein